MLEDVLVYCLIFAAFTFGCDCVGANIDRINCWIKDYNDNKMWAAVLSQEKAQFETVVADVEKVVV